MKRTKRCRVSFDTCDMMGKPIGLHVNKELNAYSKKQAIVKAMGYAKHKLGLTFSARISAENVTVIDLNAEEQARAEIERNKQDWLVNGDEY